LELGVSRSASADEIRKAFRKLAKQHHPDTNPDNKGAEEKFKRITAAFDIVGDAEKRKKFDAGEIDADGRETMRGFGGGNPFGQGGNPFGQGGGFQGGGFRGGGQQGFENVDLGDILGEMFGRGTGPGTRSSNGGFGNGFQSRGQDLRAPLEIDLEESINGGKKRIAFSDGRTLDVTIPKGASDGQVLRLKGQGAPGRAGPGDALIELKLKPHPVFRREGETLVMDVPISVPDAVLGGKVTAPIPDGGAVALSVPKGANSGQILRLKGKGLADAQVRRGDLLARLVVTLPETSDAELEKFAETWRKDRPYTPRRKA
jgi:DnaJ-class molecular chaperone